MRVFCIDRESYNSAGFWFDRLSKMITSTVVTLRTGCSYRSEPCATTIVRSYGIGGTSVGVSVGGISVGVSVGGTSVGGTSGFFVGVDVGLDT